MNNMKDVRWWKVGTVRIIALLVLGIGANGLANSLIRGDFWSFRNMSGPTALAVVLIAMALGLLGYRTDRDNEQINRLQDKTGAHPSGAGDTRLHDPDGSW